VWVPTATFGIKFNKLWLQPQDPWDLPTVFSDWSGSLNLAPTFQLWFNCTAAAAAAAEMMLEWVAPAVAVAILKLVLRSTTVT
jgi:hypothetical protein